MSDKSWEPDHTPLWANTWTFLKKSTLFFDITSLPIFSLCLPHLHNVIRDIFLSEIDETQKKILGLEVLGFDDILQYIADNQEIRENVKQINYGLRMLAC